VRKFTFWAVALAVLVIVVFNIQGWYVLSRTSRVLEQELGDRLQGVATTLSTALAGNWADEAGRSMLSNVMDDNQLFNIFIVDDRLEYVDNLRNRELVGSGDPTLDLDMAEILAAFSGIPTQSRLYRARGAYLKTAYAPLRDSAGISTAVLGVEADAGFFATLAGFRNTLLLINIVSLIAITVIIVVSVSLTRHAIRVEQAASRANTLALMGQMSAAVAHEIKNPLGVIRASAERLKKKYGNTDDPTFDYIQEEVDRLSSVVSNYLGLGRYKPSEVEPLSLEDIIEGVAADLDHQARKNEVVLTRNIEPLPQVKGNRNELRQVFLNLALNSIQAQVAGGTVDFTGYEQKKQGRQWAVVRVSDKGSGMNPKDLARAFEPFHTTKEKGSGLGLFVVKRIVDAHSGRVSIDSHRGVGTTVEIRLPV
jgi:signal transduction histidine kinase